MKNNLILILVISCFLIVNQSFSQSNKTKRQQQKYLSSYESNTLAGNDLPVLLPYNRWVNPAGEQLYFGDKNRENHALDCALSPDGKWVAVEGRYSIVIISPETKKIVSRFIMNSHFVSENAMNSFSGISWRKTGTTYELYWSTVATAGKSYVVRAGWDGKKLTVIKTFAFDAVQPAKTALPNELLVVEESGLPVLYVVLNGNNTVEKLDIQTGKTIWSVPSGVAPYGIAAAGGKLYVTNWAGSFPEKGDVNVAGVPWGSAKVDPRTGATREGTVSVFDPKTGTLLKKITVGLHPNDLISSPAGKSFFICIG